MAEPMIFDVTKLNPTIDHTFVFEKQVENDASGNAIYVGYARPGTATSATAWFITKQAYDGNNAITSQKIANDSPGFKYAWTSRATYFS